jgi:hypothetical protein
MTVPESKSNFTLAYVNCVFRFWSHKWLFYLKKISKNYTRNCEESFILYNNYVTLFFEMEKKG